MNATKCGLKFIMAGIKENLYLVWQVRNELVGYLFWQGFDISNENLSMMQQCVLSFVRGRGGKCKQKYSEYTAL